MSKILTWHERAMRHPDHQSGMVSEDMLRARMCEEIADLRAEIERLRAEIERLRTEALELARGLGKADAKVALLSRDYDDARTEVERLRKALLWYADHRNHFPVLHQRAGYPDPVAVFVEEPPIMTDGGRRARETLEGKP